MKTWDLTGGAARLELARKNLAGAWDEANLSWNDETSRRFRETYLAPLEPKLRDALDAIRRLEEVLSNAARECGAP